MSNMSTINYLSSFLLINSILALAVTSWALPYDKTTTCEFVPFQELFIKRMNDYEFPVNENGNFGKHVPMYERIRHQVFVERAQLESIAGRSNGKTSITQAPEQDIECLRGLYEQSYTKVAPKEWQAYEQFFQCQSQNTPHVDKLNDFICANLLARLHDDPVNVEVYHSFYQKYPSIFGPFEQRYAQHNGQSAARMFRIARIQQLGELFVFKKRHTRDVMTSEDCRDHLRSSANNDTIFKLKVSRFIDVVSICPHRIQHANQDDLFPSSEWAQLEPQDLQCVASLYTQSLILGTTNFEYMNERILDKYQQFLHCQNHKIPHRDQLIGVIKEHLSRYLAWASQLAKSKSKKKWFSKSTVADRASRLTAQNSDSIKLRIKPKIEKLFARFANL